MTTLPVRPAHITLFLTYLATVPAANWMINNVGTQDFSGGPHTIPVGFGYSAPSGVLLVGLALVLRDFVQEVLGRKATLGAITIGVVLSFFVNPAVAVASATAFAVSELADFGVYNQLRARNLTIAVIVSGFVGGVLDSLLFLQIAFGSIDYWQGQVIGKTLMALLGGAALTVVHAVSQRMSAQEA